MAAEESNYFLKSNEEVNRLKNQHEVIKVAMGGLVIAPVDLSSAPLRILDSATADGTWIRDLQESLPVKHHFVGTDIDPSNFPANAPEQHSYQVQDINKPWPEEWKDSFDFVHQRLALVGAGPAPKQAVVNIAALVKPGGWIQLVEAATELKKQNGPAMSQYIAVMAAVSASIGSDLTFGIELSEWLKELGFVDVRDRPFNTPLGATNPDPQLAAKGVYSSGVAVRGLVSFGKTLPKGTMPFTDEQMDKLPEALNAELKEVGGLFPLRVVWGRRPL